MGQYDEVVQRQRELLEAEEWAKGVKCLHAHSFTTLWYETNPDRTGDDLRVIDIEYNDSTIHRQYIKTGIKEIIGTPLRGDALRDKYLSRG